MPESRRTTLLMALMVAVAVQGFVLGPAWAADKPGTEDEPASPRAIAALRLPTDPASERKLQAVKSSIQQESWAEVARTLQSLLDGPDAFVMQRPLDGKAPVRWTTLYAETARRFDALPPAGREFYELVQGGRARALLAHAREAHDPQLLAEVSRRFLHTAAGAEATRLLGVYHVERGRPALAACCFERLLRLPEAEKLPAATLLAAAVAFQRAGDMTRAAALSKQLAQRAAGYAAIAGPAVRPAVKREATDWPLFRGDAARSGVGAGGPFGPVATWRHATAHEPATQGWLREAVRRQEARNEPVLPAFFPVVTGGTVVYRSHRGIHAADVHTGQVLWEFEWEGGLDSLGRELSYYPYVESWVNGHLQHNPHVVHGNSVVGTLSTDGERVYAVEDLAVPPFQNTYVYRGRPVSAVEFAFTAGLTEAVHHSRLIALDRETGKLVWERGRAGTGKHRDDLYPCYFLGPPLPIGDRLMALIEKDQELRLICLDAARGGLLWTLPLGTVPTQLLHDPGRHLQAVALAYADGVLVCPTHSGFVLGVDPWARSVLWVHCYRDPAPPADLPFQPGWRGGWRGRSTPTPVPPPSLRPHWTAAAPLIHDGKVVLTAPDSPGLHCLSLRDGALRWQARQADGDLYLASVTRDKVLLVGRQSCRVLSLADGRTRGEVATGVPAGLGAAGDGEYYLPLKATPNAKQPGLCVIRLDRWPLKTQLLSAGKEPPGNLIFTPDLILSQAVDAITAYPRRRPH